MLGSGKTNLHTQKNIFPFYSDYSPKSILGFQVSDSWALILSLNVFKQRPRKATEY